MATSKSKPKAVDQPVILKLVLNYEELFQEMDHTKAIAREMIKTARNMRVLALEMRRQPGALRLPYPH